MKKRLLQSLKRCHHELVPPASEQGWTAYLWLVYVAFFFVEWLFRPVPATELVLSLATVAGFLVLYFSAFRRQGRPMLAHVLAILALGVAWAPLNAGASVFSIYAASFAFLVAPPRRSALLVLGIAALTGLVAWLIQPSPAYWLPGSVISLIVGFANIHFGEQQRHNAELKLHQDEVRRLARQAERERIARDLHDVLGHTLSLITVKSELAGRLIDSDPERARDELASIEHSARSALAEVRQAISGFHEQSLPEALEQARSSLRAADIELSVKGGPDQALSPARQAMLALVIREAVTNIIRHSDARRCQIVFAHEGEHVRLEISDDGGGQIRASGSGIQGMRARIEAVDGELDIAPDGRASLVARLPSSEAA